MTRSEVLLRLAARLTARRDALRKSLEQHLGGFRKISEASCVGDQVDAAVEAANDEISSQLVEIESRELGQIEHALERIAAGVLRPLRILWRQDFAESFRVRCLTRIAVSIASKRMSSEDARRHRRADSNPWAKIADESIEEGRERGGR